MQLHEYPGRVPGVTHPSEDGMVLPAVLMVIGALLLASAVVPGIPRLVLLPSLLLLGTSVGLIVRPRRT